MEREAQRSSASIAKRRECPADRPPAIPCDFREFRAPHTPATRRKRASHTPCTRPTHAASSHPRFRVEGVIFVIFRRSEARSGAARRSRSGANGRPTGREANPIDVTSDLLRVTILPPLPPQTYVRWRSERRCAS